jgi:hypothetical protein
VLAKDAAAIAKYDGIIKSNIDRTVICP